MSSGDWRKPRNNAQTNRGLSGRLARPRLQRRIMKQPKKTKPAKIKSASQPSSGDTPRCGLCGKKGKLTRTECCGQWICDDEDNYVVFSYARNSCHRKFPSADPLALSSPRG